MTKSLFEVLAWAAAGGSLIFIGLLMEKLWEEKRYRNLSHFRRSKVLRHIGEWVVIGGIALEIIVAIFFAKDAWENDPRDQPVKTIKAEARLVVFTEDTPQDFFFVPAQNWWLECGGGEGKNREAIYLLTGTSEVMSPIQGAPLTNVMVIIEFKSLTADSWVFQFQAPQNQPRGPAKEVMKEINNLGILPVSFRGHAHVIRGKVALTFNDSVTKYFDIGDQELDISKSKMEFVATNNVSNMMP